MRATQQAAQQSDLLMLVLHARSPARQADIDLLDGLRAWFGSRLDLKMPPVLAVVTHIDLLSPVLEWAPPYDWQEPSRPKEVQIQRGAAGGARSSSASQLSAAVPACLAEGKVYGIDEWFLPSSGRVARRIAWRGHAALPEVRSRHGQGAKVFGQLLQVGRQVLEVWHESQRGRKGVGKLSRP